jgi:subtilisin family serine protease
VLQNDVMGVASTSDLDQRSYSSNFGNAIVWVDAPGEAIVTTYPFSTYAAGWGTSFSAPFVSGGAALLLDLQRRTNESQAAAAVAHAVWVGPEMGNGRLDLVQALSASIVTSDYSISVSPSMVTIPRGTSGQYEVTVGGLNDFTGPVNLKVSGLPRRTSVSFSEPSITGSGSSVMTLQVRRRAQPGTYTLTISGSSGSLSHSVYAILEIQ